MTCNGANATAAAVQVMSRLLVLFAVLLVVFDSVAVRALQSIGSKATVSSSRRIDFATNYRLDKNKNYKKQSTRKSQESSSCIALMATRLPLLLQDSSNKRGCICGSSRCGRRCGSRRYKLQPLQLDAQTIGEGFSEAFVGGTVGVMGVMIAVELKKIKGTSSDEQCPYCMGNGEMLCGSCCGSLRSPGSTAKQAPCTCCGGRGLVVCINCKGDGRITPIILLSKTQRDPDAAEDYLEGIKS